MNRLQKILIIPLVLLAAVFAATLVMRAKTEKQASLSAAIETPVPTETPAPTPESTPEPTPTPTPEPDYPDIDITSWEYILANADNPIGEYKPELTTVENQQFDSRAAQALSDFAAAAREQGLSVYLSSGYRGYDEQSYLYNRKVAQYGSAEIAATIVAPPGTSEHQTGLCCDITDRYYESKDSSLENTELYKWMYANCADYGFILRYPKDKEDITGIIYEPWHFRYVGQEAAKYIMENGLCFEEFVALYK